MSVHTWTLDFGNEQDKGKRKGQEDYFASFSPARGVVNSDSGFLAVVADGMGGHTGGAKASVLAVNTFIEAYKRKTAQQAISDALADALASANQMLVDTNIKTGQDSDMGTTLAAVVIQENRLFWASVGDSRIFLYRGGRLMDVNETHSYGAELDVKHRLEQISTEDLEANKKNRGMLTSYLGLKEIPRVDISHRPIELRCQEKVLMCTDGLVDALDRNEIAALLQSNKSAQEQCEVIVQHALKKNLQTQDNITIIILELKDDAKKQLIQQEREKTLDDVTLPLNTLDYYNSPEDMGQTTKIKTENPDTEVATAKTNSERSKLKVGLAIAIVVIIIAALCLYILL
ncbi:serine/threonine protein phosphatase [Candidatus Magnetobacterium bavaricum]|uniref:Serine/threonine protein phosphatase n=1 Tax=Candidatus Magnetobacterium bavaricum TaxID=29290 RepID=A0A0F3GYT7_9BACT|nr:serine/threonine protein phosphatase [Candidatus Magnetobacterium bavaricum]